MQIKSTQTIQLEQQIIAGMDLQNPDDVEFFGIKKNKTVRFLQAGKVHLFSQLASKHYILLLSKLNVDKPAKVYLRNLESQFNMELSTLRKVELYTYFLYGSLDHKPDIKNGVLQASENFRDSPFCPSLLFSGKDICIDGVPLTTRDLIIIDMAARECIDFEIAAELNISLPTLDWHKRQLFVKTGTHSKLGLIAKAFQNQVIV